MTMKTLTAEMKEEELESVDWTFIQVWSSGAKMRMMASDIDVRRRIPGLLAMRDLLES